MTDDERAIRDLVDRWMEASRSGDIETLLGLMTDDMIFMVPGREPFGKDEFRAMSQAMRGFDVDAQAEIRELRVLGVWAWISNHIEATVSAPGGDEPVHRSGYTLSVLQKGGDGRWRLARDANLVA
jgi:uncharacterized protein (TIGR02246 family)